MSLENGHLGSFDLHFDQHSIDSRLSWESDELSSQHFAQRNHLLISDAYIFVGTESGRICRITRSNSDERKFYESTGDKPILGLALSPGGQSLLTTNADGLITLFNVNNPNPLFQLQSIQIGVKGLVFSPCGRYFAAGDYGWDRRLVLFSIENQEIKEISSHKLGVQTTAIFWGKDYILSTHTDGIIRTFLVDPNNFSLISPPKDHKTPFLGYQLAHAILKRNEASDTLYVSCTATKEIIEVEVEKSLKIHSKKLDSHFSKYTTIR
ncbi:MAG TPA: hypothetical protein DCE71_02315 [Parachlamydiales bacterium]|nr:hypothetical protein [Parachlamydiales bacterium]